MTDDSVTDAMTLVPMTTAHVDRLMPYEREMFGPEAWTASGYRGELADTDNRYYVAVEGPSGELLGWAGVLVIAESAEILGHLFSRHHGCRGQHL